MQGEYTTVKIDRADGITTISLNRPDKKNAMNPTMHREMVDVLTRLEGDKETRVLIITGAGDSFCAGQDLKEYFYEHPDAKDHAPLRVLSNEWRVRRLRSFPAPTIAAVNGWCFGGAFSIVCSCDIAIAAEEAQFGLSEINFGTFPGGMVTKQVSDIMRPRDALFYVLTGRRFDGKKAAEMGFVNFAVPRATLRDETMALARELKEKNPEALRVAKEVYRHSLSMDYEQAWNYSSAKTAELTDLQKGEWLSKGIGDFMEGKYKPGLGAYKREG